MTVNDTLQKLAARKKILTDNQAYFSHCAIILVNTQDKEHLMERLNALFTTNPEMLADASVVWDLEAQIDQTKMVHVYTTDTPVAASRGNRFMAEIDDELYADVCNFIGNTALMMYRHVYTYEPSKHPVNSFRTIRDRTNDLVLGKLIDATAEHHALPEIIALRDVLASHGS